MRNVTCFVQGKLLQGAAPSTPFPALSSFHVRSQAHYDLLKEAERLIIHFVSLNRDTKDWERWQSKGNQPGLDPVGEVFNLLTLVHYTQGPQLLEQPADARKLFDLMDKMKEFIGCMAQSSTTLTRSPKLRKEWRDKAIRHFEDLEDACQEVL